MASEAARARAREDFDQARKEAALQDILAGLRRKSAGLIPFEDIRERFTAPPDPEEVVRAIPLAAVIGSVGRYNDFNRDFLPRSEHDRERWTSVRLAMESGVELPPIQVYQVGEVYFVIDGNHRVSIAKRRGDAEIRARVTRIPARVAFSPDDPVEEVARKAEYNRFLEATRLDEHFDDLACLATEASAYRVLLGEIEALRTEAGGERPLPDAARDWYEDRYLPVIEVLRRRNLLRHYPHRTETDLYIWILENREALAGEFGWGVELETVAADFGPGAARGPLARLAAAAGPERSTGKWRERQLALERGRLFADIVVLVESGTAGDLAVAHALHLAAQEGSHLLGLAAGGDREGGD
ncbi:MAG TPA: hypothetical protein VMN57_05155, partial [Anaerolineales bacterium]|nr:hypothetical protein [Anaerolineales bacterium]